LFTEKKTTEMKRRKHVILIGEAEELRELHDEWTCRDACIAVDALFVSDEPFVDESASWHRYDWDAVEGFLRQHPEVKEVCCTSAAMRDGDLKRLCYLCEELHVRFTFVSSGISSLHRRMSVERRGGMSLLTPCRPLLCSPCWRMFKRAGDVLVCAILLLTVFPLVYVVRAVKIKRKSPGPVFVRQKRSGPDGKVFHCLTFRLAEGQTPSRLDSMPQLLNVLFGEMSLVGMPLLTAESIEPYLALADRYHVRRWPKPGLTQWSRVCSHREQKRELSALENMVADDVWYDQHWTPWTDLQILLRTYCGMNRWE
jgi:putative colanic acid biosynthesis UDP-glucose lipid carrier transferase